MSYSSVLLDWSNVRLCQPHLVAEWLFWAVNILLNSLLVSQASLKSIHQDMLYKCFSWVLAVFCQGAFLQYALKSMQECSLWINQCFQFFSWCFFFLCHVNLKIYSKTFCFAFRKKFVINLVYEWCSIWIFHIIFKLLKYKHAWIPTPNLLNQFSWCTESLHLIHIHGYESLHPWSVFSQVCLVHGTAASVSPGNL